MKENEKWMEKLKEKLADYVEPVSASGWERLEKELIPPVEKRIYPYRRWAMVAATVLLVMGTSLSLYFLGTPAADEIRQTNIPTMAAVPDRLPQPSVPASRLAQAEPANPAATSVRQVQIAVSESIELQKEDQADKQPSENLSTHKDPSTHPQARQPRKPSARDKLHLPETPATPKSGHWSVGVSVGNAGTLSGNGNVSTVSRTEYQLDAPITNGIVQIPVDQTLIFKEGVPYLQQSIVDMKHHQPLSFGISVRKGLSKGFSVETGVTYTLLSSDVKMANTSVMEDQKLHYIGIPVRANWNFLDQKLLTLYVSAGGAVEKCVYGELAGSKKTVKPLQLSLMGALGAQINATRHLGVYVEPGVAYFFDDGSDVQTIRKETPFNFNIQAGVRFTY
ncbi:MAG: outer membrane beta-barrel protein [Bacteroides sp.]